MKDCSVKFDQVGDDSLQQAILKGNDNEQSIIEVYITGQDCSTSSIKEFVVTLIKRLPQGLLYLDVTLKNTFIKPRPTFKL